MVLVGVGCLVAAHQVHRSGAYVAYGISVDCVDECLNIIESTTMEYMKNLAAGIIQVFGDEYLKKPTQADVD